LVVKKTREPSVELPSKVALNAPFPPVEPVERSVVTPEDLS